MAHDFNGNNNAAVFTQEETGKISAVTSIGVMQIDDSICDLSVDDMLNAINAGNKKTPMEEIEAMEASASVEEEAEENTGILRRYNPAVLEERLKLEEAERKRREEEEKAEEEALRLKQERLKRLNPLSLFKKKQEKEQNTDDSEAEEQSISKEDSKPLQDKNHEKGGKWLDKIIKENPLKKESEEKPVMEKHGGPEKKNRQPVSFSDLIPFAKKDKTDKKETTDTPLAGGDDKDPLTGFLNKKAYNALKTQDALGQSVVLVQVRGMDEIKNTFGQSACSLTLITVSREIEKIFTKSTCCYIGKDKFAILPPASDNSFKKIFSHVKALEDALKLSSENDMMPYYISAGYCVAEKSLSFTEAVRTAEKILQEEISGTAAAPAETPEPKKEAPKTEISKERQEEPPVKTTKIPDDAPDITPDFHEDRPLSGAEYDEQLTPAQRRLRASVINYHSQPTLEQIEAAVNMVESHYDRVTAVFMSDSEFTTLCVFRNVDTFIDIVKEAEYNIDYSYCYVLLESEIHCYGNDPDNNEVTKIFENLSNALKSGKVSSKEDIAKISGINIFHNIILE